MAKQPWWIWVGGGFLLLLVAHIVLGGAFALLGALIAGIVKILGAVVGVAFSLIGSVLGAALNLLVLGGLGYLGYRWWKERQLKSRETSWSGGARE